MDAVIELLKDNPIYAAGLALLLLLLVFSLAKRMMKVLLLAIALNIAYVYFLQERAEDLYASGKKQAEELIDEAGKLIKR